MTFRGLVFYKWKQGLPQRQNDFLGTQHVLPISRKEWTKLSPEEYQSYTIASASFPVTCGFSKAPHVEHRLWPALASRWVIRLPLSENDEKQGMDLERIRQTWNQHATYWSFYLWSRPTTSLSPQMLSNHGPLSGREDKWCQHHFDGNRRSTGDYKNSGKSVNKASRTYQQHVE